MKPGDRIGEYEIISVIGSGGNGKVFKVKKDDGELYALKTVKVNINNLKKNLREQTRIKRFINEINVVKSVQNKIPGVLPILDDCMYTIEQINKDNKPYYVMPIAVPLEEKINEFDFEEKIYCILELCETLIQLHNRGIAHRDIKPDNIYWLDGTWYLSDFGLVKYPEGKELTKTREPVGPWTTLAPEMKRNAKNANPFPADIYSLAKTLWMILTNRYKGFDGQYNYKNSFISLENFCEGLKNPHLTTLHQLLHLATSDEPNNRQDALGFCEDLKKWIEIKDDFEKRSKAEWDFIIQELCPSQAESLSWRRVDTIVNVLSSISKLGFLNHMFLPEKGGLDLIGCKHSNQKGYIELNLNGITRIIKPKRLCLETFDDPQWNHLFLETEEIQPSGVYEYDISRKPIEESVLEIRPGEYIEPYHANYGEYRDEPLPTCSRSVSLGLKGSYVVFPKYSYYNLGIDGYDAFQNLYNTPEKFREFIQKIINHIEWRKNNPEEVEKLAEKEKQRREEERKIYSIRYAEEEEEILGYSNNYNLDFCESYVQNPIGKFKYYIELGFVPSITLYPSKKYTLEIKKERALTLEILLNREDKFGDYLEFYKWNELEAFINKVKEDYSNLIKQFEILNSIDFYIRSKRVYKPSKLFTRQDIEKVIFNANDQVTNQLVVNEDGEIELIPIESKDEKFKLEKYPVVGEVFYKKTNSVGNSVEYSVAQIEEIYKYMLDTWYRHLVDGERKSLSDYCTDSIEELLEKIKIAEQKYESS
ncbi:TPA: serine/threonine protein kinase [Bacillus cereus]